MQKRKLSPDLRLALALLPVGALAGALITLYQISMFDAVQKAGMPPVSRLVIAGAIQVMLYIGISAILGLKLARRTGLNRPVDLALPTIGWSVLTGFICASVIMFSDRLFFMPRLPQLSELASKASQSISWLNLAATVLYGGVVEEIMMRLFLMSLVVWLLQKMLRVQKSAAEAGSGQKQSGQPAGPDWIYWLASAVVAILFALGHLPGTAALFGLTPLLVIRSLALNGFAGFLFGLLFWKRGIASAILAHGLTHVFIQLVITPLFF